MQFQLLSRGEVDDMKQKQQSNAGFTLFELMIVVGLMTIISVFMVSLLNLSRNAFSIGSRDNTVKSEAKRALELIAQELREADANAPNVPGFSNGNIDLANGNTQVTFLVPNQLDEDGPTSWTRVRYSLNQAQNQIERTNVTAGTAPTVIARNALVLPNGDPPVQFTLLGGTDDVVTAVIELTDNTRPTELLRTRLGTRITFRNRT
jgi:prepilin-type N-terminal cleavage/methylation domain-containing protein